MRGDYEIASYFLSSHLDFHFRKTLFAARPFEGGRHLLGHRLTPPRPQGDPERRLSAAFPNLAKLTSLFLIDVPEGCVSMLATALDPGDAQ